MLITAAQPASLTFVQRGAWIGYPRGHPVGLAIAGNLAFTSTQDSGVAVYDISDPTRPRPIGGFSDGISYAADVRIQGSYAFVAGGDSGLHILSLVNPAAPVRVGRYIPPFPGPGFSARGVFVAGTLAFMAADLAGLLIVNVSNPANPMLVGSYDTSGRAQAVYVSGGFAYVADDTAGLRVIDIRNPANPILVGTCDTPGTAYGVEVSAGYAYVADAFSGVQIIDARSPSNPTIVATYATGDFVQNLRVIGPMLAVSAGALRLVDISTPTNPVPIGSSAAIAQAQDLDVSGSVACIADYSGGFHVLDLSSQANPATVGFHKGSPGNSRRVRVSGTRAYVADYAGGMQILDVTSPANPVELGHIDGYIESVAVTNNLAYLAGSGLHIYDVADATHPIRLGGRTNLYSYDIQLDGGFAFLTDYNFAIAVYDVRDPAAVLRAGSPDRTWEGYRVHLAWPLAYVTGTYGQLGIFDISYQDEPQLRGSYYQGGRGGSATTRGQYAFFANSANGLEILDVSQITNPTRVASYTISNAIPGGIQLRGKYAYIAFGTAGLRVLDISDPTHPSLAGAFDTGGNAADVEVVGRYVYIADGAWGVTILEQVGNANLSASATPGGMLLSWPPLEPTATLEQAEEPGVPWAPVANASQNSYLAPLDSAKRFYRLSEPYE